MKYKFYTTSEKTWTGMLDAITRAEKSVYWEIYIFLNDTVPTHDFFSVLAEKARQGVKVKIVVDIIGSYPVWGDDVRALQEAGGEVLFFTFWTRRLHRKILIIDEKTAFLGGVNVGKEYLEWLDLHMRIEGPMARALVRSFAHTYHMCGGKDPLITSREESKVVGKAEHWFLEHIPMGGKNDLARYYREHLREAKRRIVLVSPYFFPHRWLTQAIRDARARGVEVEIILPLITSPRWTTFANYAFAGPLSAIGVKFYFTREVIHAKVLLVDDEEGLVGSQNLDAQSFDYNIEAGIAFRQADMVRDLRKIVEDWKRVSVVYGPEVLRRRWYHYPLDVLARMLQPLI